MSLNRLHFFTALSRSALAISIGTCLVACTKPRSLPLPDEGALFSKTYPADKHHHQALYRLRTGRRLSSDSETQIRRKVSTLAERFALPEAILGCTLFLQSGLNHLDGAGGEKTARGLGQFLPFDVTAFNAKPDRYTAEHSKWFQQEAGSSDSKLQFDSRDTQNGASYFNPSTAVAATALVLHDRYTQLRTSLEANTIRFDPELLWILTGIAYAKSPRMVLGLWNEIQSVHGRVGLEEALNQRAQFKRVFSNSELARKALSRTWSPRVALILENGYLDYIHGFSDCAVRNSAQEASNQESTRRNL